MQLPDGTELWTVTSPTGEKFVFSSGGRYIGFITAGCDMSDESILMLSKIGMDMGWEEMQGEI